VSNLRSQNDRTRGLALRTNHQRKLDSGKLAAVKRNRALRVESLEPRTMLYAYPFGALPDDTGEYMLGDVAVNVVLMESDPTLAPYDNNPLNHPTQPGIGAEIEDWDGTGTAINSIAAVKNKVLASLQWWKDTLVTMFPNAPGNLQNFHINWEYADNPVRTGYEPIARTSNEFVGAQPGTGWLYDFLDLVDFNTTGNFSSDIRAYNDYTRQQANTDWAFTIFVVNNANDDDKFFAPGGAFDQAFSFAGGRFMIVPANRPTKTFTHEAGHQFWALDQYLGGGTYDSQRGYYNTPNLNAADNPEEGFVQADSIMTNDPLMANSFNNHTLDVYAMAQLGWQDTNTPYGEANNGIFDVLDVPFTLTGLGQYNAVTGKYEFRGATHVNTYPNLNSSGTRSDITINQVRILEASIDGGPWESVASFPARTYQTDIIVDIPLGPGSHEIRIRSADTRTGVKSNVFVGSTDEPVQDSEAGISGVVFLDENSNGSWDSGEPLQPDVGLAVTDFADDPIQLNFVIEPSDEEYTEGQRLDGVHPDVTLSAIGTGRGTGGVYARTSSILTSPGNRVFAGQQITGAVLPTWNSNQRLKVQFASPVSFVSLRAYGSSTASSSFARLEAYTADGVLVQRFTAGGLSKTGFTEMTVDRPQGDIDHVIAYGHLGTSVVLDTLRWGPAASATTNSFGVYDFGYLPDGSYRVHLSAPPGYSVTTPITGYASVSVVGGKAAGSVNFGIAVTGTFHRFHNQTNAFNVDNDSGNFVVPNDALAVINFLNAFGSLGEGEIAPEVNPNVVGYIDVNDDGFCAPNDALDVINYINAHGSGNSGPGGEPPPAGSFPGGGNGEGESRLIVPQNAADYFAQREMPLLQLPGDDEPCGCARCVGSATDQILQQQSPLLIRPEPIFARSWFNPITTASATRLPDDTPATIDEAIDDLFADLSDQDVFNR
jgi:hypothetical protein